jgi:hypothetical protein
MQRASLGTALEAGKSTFDFLLSRSPLSNTRSWIPGGEGERAISFVSQILKIY